MKIKKYLNESYRLIESYSVGYVKTDSDHPLVYSVEVEEPRTNAQGESYQVILLHLVCGWDYCSTWSDKLGWIDADNFVDDVQLETLIAYDGSIKSTLAEEGYIECEKPSRIYTYDENRDEFVIKKY